MTPSNFPEPTTVPDLPTQLLDILKDGEKGFAAAEQDTQRPDLRQLFHKYSLQRADLGMALQRALNDLGAYQAPVEASTGSVAAMLHRGWMVLRSTVTTRDDLAVLDECIRGEESALQAFAQASNDRNLSEPLRALIAEQHEEIAATCLHLRKLRQVGQSSAQTA